MKNKQYAVVGLGRISSLSSIFLAMASLAWGPAVHAATVRTWTGASSSSGNWSSAANWLNGAPVAGDILNFVTTGARKNQ